MGTSWMHKVVDEAGVAEITFGLLGASDWLVQDIIEAVERIEGGTPDAAVPVGVADTRIRTWIISLDGETILVTVATFADTTPAQIDETAAIVESIRVEPEADGTSRLVFMLPEGWDSG